MYCCVYSEKTADDGQRNCPKHVEFYSKNKFEKLVHPVGFIIRIYHESITVYTAIHTGYADCLLASSQQTCMTYTIAVCTVKNC